MIFTLCLCLLYAFSPILHWVLAKHRASLKAECVSATVWIRLALGMCFKCALGHEVSELKVHIRKVIDPALQEP